MKKQKKEILKKLSLQLICYMVFFDSTPLFAMEPEAEPHQENSKTARISTPSSNHHSLSFMEFLEQSSEPEKGKEKKERSKHLLRKVSVAKKPSVKISEHLEKAIEPILETKTLEISSSALSPEDIRKNSSSSVSPEESQKSSPSSASPEEESQKSSPSSASPEESQKYNSLSLSPEKLHRKRSSSASSEKHRMSSFSLSKTKNSEKNIPSFLGPSSENYREEKDDENSVHFPIRKSSEWNKSYMECAEYFFRKCKSSSEVGKVLVYSSPLFIPEYKDLFAGLINLKQKYSLEITAFLEQLALAAFPNGIKNLQAAETEFNELKEGLMVPPLLNMCFSNNFTPIDSINEKVKKISDLIILNELNNDYRIDMNNLHVGKFMDALLIRDKFFFENAPLEAIKSDKSPPESIATLAKHFTRTAFWVALNIVSGSTENERAKQFKLFSFIGHLLIKSKNFHGAMQIAMGLNRHAVMRLMSAETLKNKNWEDICDFIKQEKNFKNYRKMVLSCHGQGFLPVFSMISSDLMHAFEGYEPTRELQSRLGTIEAIAKTLETFLSYRALPSPHVDPQYMKLVCGFRDVHEETLEVFSDLWKKWPAIKDSEPELSVELKNWTPLYFASMLRQYECTLQISTIFKEIHDGNDLIAYMGETSLEEKEKKLYDLKINKEMVNVILLAQGFKGSKK